jgi:hypothetical protein
MRKGEKQREGTPLIKRAKREPSPWFYNQDHFIHLDYKDCPIGTNVL